MTGTARLPCWDGKTQMAWVWNDGGRQAAGFKGRSGDCVCRSIAIAMQLPYPVVHAAIDLVAVRERPRQGGKRSQAEDGVHNRTSRRFLLANGWRWVPTMTIGSGARVHLCEEELPMGRLILCVSRHMTCVIDRVIHDTFNPSRASIVSQDGTQRIARRCVYGYFTKD